MEFSTSVIPRWPHRGHPGDLGFPGRSFWRRLRSKPAGRAAEPPRIAALPRPWD